MSDHTEIVSIKIWVKKNWFKRINFWFSDTRMTQTKIMLHRVFHIGLQMWKLQFYLYVHLLLKKQKQKTNSYSNWIALLFLPAWNKMEKHEFLKPHQIDYLFLSQTQNILLL